MRISWLVTVCLILGFTMGLFADDPAYVDAAHQVLKQYGSSVVSLATTAKIDLGAGNGCFVPLMLKRFSGQIRRG